MLKFHGTLESALRYHRFHERLNHSIKVQMLALGLLANEVDAGASASELGERVRRRPAWLWGGEPDWTRPEELVLATRREAAQGAVARAYSAFDLFVDELTAELQAWQHASGQAVLRSPVQKHSAPGPAGDADKIATLYMRLGAERSELDELWSTYQYFRLARDCIVHREGLASAAMQQSYEDFGDNELKRWIIRAPASLPPVLLRVAEGEQINFNHRQVIAASSTLRRIVVDINRIVVETLGVAGFVYCSARRAFSLDDDVLHEVMAADTLAAALNSALRGRYRVRGMEAGEHLRVLKELGVKARFQADFAEIKKRNAKLPPRKPGGRKARKAQKAVDSVVDLLIEGGDTVAYVEAKLMADLVSELDLELGADNDGEPTIQYRGVELRQRVMRRQ